MIFLRMKLFSIYHNFIDQNLISKDKKDCFRKGSRCFSMMQTVFPS